MTTAPLFFVDELPTSGDVTIDGPEGHHAAAVRRLTLGESVVVGDGRGGTRAGEVVAVGAGQVQVRCGPLVRTAPSDPAVVLVQALAKNDRAELAVEVSTELGVDAIIPWSAERSIVQWRGERGEKSRRRWATTAREAAKQSRRPWIPPVADVENSTGLVRRVADFTTTLVLHEAADQRLAAIALPATGTVALVVGPEGGVSPAELERLAAAGAVPVRLGDTVLRTSTAGGAAVAALSLRLGRWS